MSTLRSPKDLAGIAGLAAVYFAAAKLGLELASVHVSASPVWPPTGIALAALLLLGQRAWPGVWVGAFAANITVAKITAESFATTMGIATGNTLEAVVGAWLVNRWAGGVKTFERPRDFFRFVVLAAGVSTLISATIGVTGLALGGSAPWAKFGPIWLTWWLGDLTGSLIITPLVVLWWQQPAVPWSRLQKLEAVLLLLTLFVAAQLCFGGLFFRTPQNYPLSFLCVPPLVWAAFRFTPRETATALVLLSGIAITNTLQGFGPFARNTPNESLLLLQAFMGVNGVTAIGLATVVQERREALAARQQSEVLVRQITEGIREVFYVQHVHSGLMLYVSPAYEAIWGRSCESLRREPLSYLDAIVPAHRERVWRSLAAQARGISTEEEYAIIHVNGSEHWIRHRAFPIRDEAGQVYRVIGIAEDITERVQAKEALSASEARAQAMLDSALDCIISVDHEGKIIEFNPAAEKTFGYLRAKVIGKGMADLIIPAPLREAHRQAFARVVKAAGDGRLMGRRLELTAVRANGAEFPVELTITRVGVHGSPVFLGCLRDITEQKRSEAEIKASLEEKEVMLKEINHRVKNNLQIISSLLTLQAESTADESVQVLFRESQSRVRTMALIHENLYQSPNLARVEFELYVRKLAVGLLHAFGTDSKKVRLLVQIPELFLPIDTAIPCGLIINELASNALKYAFPAGRAGEIIINLVREDGTLCLTVRDNGVGLPPGLDIRRTKTLGLQLVVSLAQQLHGTLEARPGSGTEFRIAFPHSQM